MSDAVVAEPCGKCGKPGTAKCARCKKQSYCSRECQTEHWKSHKQSCVDPNKLTTLVIETLQAGDGKTFPTKGKSVTVHYTGRLLSNGKQFDSSRDRNDPFVFTIGVGQVIRGWDEGVAQMSVGQRALIKIPSDMGYGARGAGRDIPANADLVFDVELLKC